MKYPDLHKDLNPPADYPLDEIFDELLLWHKNLMAFESHQLGALEDLPSKRLSSELSRIIAELEPAVRIFEDTFISDKNVYVLSLLSNSDVFKTPREASDAGIEAARALRAALDTAMKWKSRGKGRPEKATAPSFISYLQVLYEHFTKKKASTNTAFMEFCEHSFGYAGIDIKSKQIRAQESTDERARLKSLINAANRPDEDGESPLDRARKSAHIWGMLRLKK